MNDAAGEAPNTNGDLFGIERVQAVLQSVGDASLSEIRSAVLDAGDILVGRSHTTA